MTANRAVLGGALLSVCLFGLSPAMADKALDLGNSFVPMQDAALETVGTGPNSRRAAEEELVRAGEGGNDIRSASTEPGGSVTQMPTSFKIISTQSSTAYTPPPSTTTSPTTGGTTTVTNTTIFGGSLPLFGR